MFRGTNDGFAITGPGRSRGHGSPAEVQRAEDRASSCHQWFVFQLGFPLNRLLSQLFTLEDIPGQYGSGDTR